MEGEAVAAVLQVLVQNLINHSKKELSLVRGLEKEAKKLSESLDTIQKFLNDAEKRTIPGEGEAIKSWLKKLENVAFDADNVLDELNYHHLCKQIRPIKPMKRKVLSCISSPCVNISRSRNMALRIQEINENLEVINKEAADLGLKEMLATNVPTLPDVSRETDSFTLDPIFIGRDKVMSEIVEKVTACITTDERVSIHAIVGMGGLGKTTLTRKVFHLLKEKNRFGSHIWVHVSQIFDPIVLLKKILKELTSSGQVEVESRQDILKKIQEALNNKSYLLILDDVWNEDRPTWDAFINSLLGVSSIKGNFIVVTTRSMVVATTVNALPTYKLEGLPEEDCWSIIKAKTFGKEDVPSQFEAIGIEIAKKCQGLPLAANVVGGVLHNKSEEEWRSTKDNWLSQDEGDHIRKILKLSFDNLSLPSLKKCFAYCSVFPKGHRIERQKLIEYWVAEGFLVADRSSDMESMGDKFISVLIHNSLLQIAKRDDYDGNVESCVMHDLVHDLASSVLAGSHNADGITPVRYMFFEEKSSDILKQNAKYLRTLIFMYNIYGNKFAEFQSLHVLTLRSFHVKELPSSIKKLIHLRVLDINESRIYNLPNEIGKLVCLQTLRAEKRYLGQLPSTLKYLTNLRHLYIRDGVELPAGIGRLISLQTLEYFEVGDKDGCKIEELGSLNGLKGKLKISELERVDNKEEAEKASLSAKSKLLDLCFTWDQNREGEITKDENVLEGLKPHSNLKKLKIEGFKGKRFPLWIQRMEVEKVDETCSVPLSNLIEISLIDCSECEEIPMFGQLPNLKSLLLEGLANLKSINSSFYGLVNEETRIVFPALETLELTWMDELTEWAEVESVGASDAKVFPQLQHLEIKYCPKLKGFPLEMIGSSLESLELVNVSSLENLPGIVDRLPKSPHLTHLEIIGVPQLMTSCSGIYAPFFSRLEVLALDASMGGSMETVDALLQACRSSSRSLQSVTLKGIESWENLVESLQLLHEHCRLKLETIGMEKLPHWLRNMNESRRHLNGNSLYIEINGERIWMPLTEIRTLLHSGNL